MTYTWNIGTATTVTTAPSVATGNLTTATTYSVAVTNANGCTSTVSNTGTIPVASSFTQSNPSAATICYNATNTFSLAAATGGLGTISYQWQQSGNNSTWTNATGTGTNATYTTPALTSNMYYRRTATGATCGAATSSSAFVTVHPAFSAGSITTASYKSCNNVAGTATAVPSGGTPTGSGSFSYQWTVSYNAGAAVTINGATLATYTPPATATAGTYRYMRQVKDGLCNTAFTNSAGTVTREVYQAFSAGAITTASTTTAPGTAPNVTIANASSATGGDGNITYQWRRSGTSSATLTGSAATYALSADASNYGTAGIYYFTRYAKHSSCNSAYTLSTGQYTLTVKTYDPFSDTWVIGTQTWSGALRNPVSGCASVTSLTTSNYTTREYKDNGSTYGYYYSWACVSYAASTLCPSPWHVPTQSDFSTLILNTYYYTLIERWGRPGIATGANIGSLETYGFIWSATSYDSSFAYALRYNAEAVDIFQYGYKYYGLQVRCVR
jgi:hypothetical protein